MKYFLSGIIGFVLTLIVSLPFQNLVRPKDAKAFTASMKSRTDPTLSVTADKNMEVDIKIQPIVRLEDKKDQPLIKFFPQYPAEAAAQKIEGFVTLSFRVSKEGLVQNLKVMESSPPQIFDEVALAAVSKWTFASKPNQPLLDQQKLRLNFNLGRTVAAEQQVTESEL